MEIAKAGGIADLEVGFQTNLLYVQWCFFANVCQIAISKSAIPPMLSARLEAYFIDKNLPWKLQLPTGPLDALSWLADQFTKDFLMFYVLRISKTQKTQISHVDMGRDRS